MGISTVFMQLIHGIKEAIAYTKEFDDATVNLTKVVDLSNNQIKEMQQSAIELGKSLGKSSVDIMGSFAEFGRVTKNTEEIKELARTATMMSNVTEMTASDSAKAINTTMIAFKLNAKDSINVLDQWNELQNNYRVSATDLADSIGKVGNVALQTGLSLSKLNAMTTAIASSTGATGDESGTMVKSVLSRIYRLGSEGEEDAGKSEEVLDKIGVSVRKSATEFRSSEEIIDELAKKWNGLNNVQQINIAQTLAGKMCA